MKSKLFKQFICIFLVVVFVVQLIPVYAYPIGGEDGAEEVGEASETISDSEESITDEQLVEDATVIGEVKELREESVKHYRMSDGSFVAIEFDEPVHYKNSSGEFVDIDNTLKLDNSMGKNVFTATTGDVTKHFASSITDDQFLFDVEYKDYSVSISLADNVAKEVSDSKEDALDEGYLLEEADESGTEVDIEKTNTPDSTISAKVSNPSEEADDISFFGKTIEELGMPVKYSSEVSYDKVLPNTDFVYNCNGYNVKESIIVREKQENHSYQFLLNLSNLTPILDDSGAILLNNNNDDTVFIIPAPYMFDDAGAASNAVSYSLKACEGGYLLTIDADGSWMNDDARKYPITIDPQVSLHYNVSNLKTAYIRQGSPNGTSPSFGDLKCGKYNENGYGACELCIQVENLPSIPSNCVITSAQMQIAHMGLFSSNFGSGVGGSVTVDVRKVNGTINDLTTVKWNTIYGASGLGVQSRILDYRILNESTLGTFVGWDVTPAVLGWYENNSTKGTLLFVPENETTIGYFANLTGHAWYENSPYFVVQYRNTVGVESYYTYRTLSAARAGDIYISDFTSQITLMNTDVSLSTDAVSAEISHVYNTAYTNNLFTSTSASAGIHTCNYSNMDVGKGWKLSIQQTVVPLTISGYQYLLYSDGDGTEHYFIKTATNTYQDEDGLGLKIVKSTSGGNTIYTMTDADANTTWVFHNGYLISITDSNGNAEYIAYNSNYSTANNNWKPTASGSNKIVQVTMVPKNGALITVATLGYSGNRLRTITDKTSRVTLFEYDSNGRLNTITYPDSVIVYYQYDNNGNIWKVYDNESHYGLTFTYWSNHHGGYWVNKVTEFTATSVNGTQTAGVAFHGYNTSAQQKQYRYYGEDHLSDTPDDIVEHYVFDYMGKTICVYQTDYLKEEVLGASTASYTSNNGAAKTNNRITGVGSLGIINPVKNIDSGFENSDYVTGGDSTASILTASGTTDNRVHTGYNSLHFNRENASAISQGGFNVQLSAGKTYTISCYVLNYTATNWSDSSYGKIVIKGTSSDTANLFASDPFNSKTTRSIDRGWEKISFSFTPNSTRQYFVAVQASGFTGDYYVDDFQIEESDVATSTNLLLNGNPESSSRWNLGSGASYTTENTTKFGSGVFKAVGDSAKNTSISQDVKIYDSEPGTYILSGWGKAEAVGSSEATYDGHKPYFGMLAAVVYEGSDSEEWHFIPFSSDYTDWQYASGIVVPKKSDPVNLIRVYLFYTSNANTAYFDNISLIREPVQTYTYDDKGNPVSAKDGGAKTECEYETGTSLMTKYTAATGVEMGFTYQPTTHNLLTTTYDGITTTNTYNNGLLTQSVTTNSADNTRQRTSSVYDSGTDQASNRYGLLTQTIDVNNITTNYGYDSSFRPISRTSTIGGESVTQNTSYYTNTDRVKSTYISGKAVQYNVYSNGMLENISRKTFNTFGVTNTGEHWQSYHFTYNSFGNPLTLDVNNKDNTGSASNAASRNLVSYAYDPAVNNGLLQQIRYSNGDTVDYSYDKFDRITEERYNNGRANHYVYSADGSLSKQYSTNSSGATTESYSYEYDSLGRLIRSKETASNPVFNQRTEHVYDTADRLTMQTWYNGSGATTQTYEYGTNDGLLNKLSIYFPGNTYYEIPPAGSSNSPSLYYNVNYNNLNQLTGKTTMQNNSALFTRAFSYRFLGDNFVTNQVKFMNYRIGAGGSSNLIYGNRYEYDATGNISEVYDNSTNSRLWHYTYDSMNQLTGAVYGTGSNSDSYSYTYDTAGNIRTATKNGDTKYYAYDDAAWADLLTEYDGHSITYDNSGNPLSYYNGTRWDFTWEKGRQLASAESNAHEISYTYDMSGTRSSKTVDGTTYNYTTLSGLVYRQEWAGKIIDFLYDDASQPYAMIYKTSASADPVTYFYILNLQGDVVGLMKEIDDTQTGNDNDGPVEIVALYEYDPWGKVTVRNKNGTENTSSDFIGNINPLRYRGYYYDTETGFYYLQSRYYDPAICRFINADGQINSGLLGTNLFAYCGNNPINNSDPSGEKWRHWLIGAAVVVGFGLLTVATCGGSLAVAATSVAFVANGIWAGSTAATIAASAFVGAATTYGVAALTAWSESSSAEEFADKGNWGTVAITAGGALVGGTAGYLSSKCQSQNTVGREYNLNGLKSESYINKRGWTDSGINAAISNGVKGISTNKANGNPCSVYCYPDTNSYIVIDDITNSIVQASQFGDSSWIPDPIIKWF